MAYMNKFATTKLRRNGGLLIFFCFMIFASCFSQTQPFYNQFMINYHLVNPAFAGSQGYSSMELSARQQWLGFKGTPTNIAISGQTRLLKRYSKVSSGSRGNRLSGSRSGRVGLGGYLFNDSNGDVARTGMQFSYAYHIFIWGVQVSMGLTASGYQIRYDKSDLWVLEDNDKTFDQLKNTFIPDATIGGFVTHNTFYGGVSVSQVFQEYLKYLEQYKISRNYFVIGGYKYFINRENYIEPGVFLKISEDLKDPTRNSKRSLYLEGDFSVKAYIKDQYWGGAGYRTTGSVVFMGGVQLSSLHLAYAFDYPLSSGIKSYSYGSHELLFYTKFGTNTRRNRFKEYF